MHWSEGLFGYFPTYTLGNVYAGCLYEGLRKDVPTLDDDLSRGETGHATKWLNAKIQTHGSLYPPQQVMTQATGSAPTEGPLLDYLETKFKDLYDI